MTFDLEKMIAGKRAFRQDLSARPIGEKLRMLDALRERELAIRGGKGGPGLSTFREEPPRYPTKGT